MTTWVINTNSNTCHIYDYKKKPDQLNLIEAIAHPENKLKDQDLITDTAGHYHSRIANRGAYSQKTDPKDHLVEVFAREIAKKLNEGRNEHAFEKLVIIAEPHMNGLLFKHLDKHVSELVVNNIKKDVIFLKQHELLAFLNENAPFAGNPKLTLP